MTVAKSVYTKAPDMSEPQPRIDPSLTWVMVRLEKKVGETRTCHNLLESSVSR